MNKRRIFTLNKKKCEKSTIGKKVWKLSTLFVYFFSGGGVPLSMSHVTIYAHKRRGFFLLRLFFSKKVKIINHFPTANAATGASRWEENKNEYTQCNTHTHNTHCVSYNRSSILSRFFFFSSFLIEIFKEKKSWGSYTIAELFCFL